MATMKVKQQNGSKHRTRLPNGATPAKTKKVVEHCKDCERAYNQAMDAYLKARKKALKAQKAGKTLPMPKRPKRTQFQCVNCKIDHASDHYNPLKKPQGIVTVKAGEDRKKALDKGKKKRVKQRKRTETTRKAKASTNATTKRKSNRKSKVLKAQWCATFGKDKGGIYHTPKGQLMTRSEAQQFFANNELDSAAHEVHSTDMDGTQIVKRKVAWKASYDLWPVPGTETF